MKHILTALFTLLSAGAAVCKAPSYAKSSGDGNEPNPPGVAVANCQYGTARAELDINNVRALIHNGGDMWWDLATSARYEVPKVTDPSEIRRTALFAGAIWVGGYEGTTNNLVISAQTYRSSSGIFSFWPGPIDTLTQFTDARRCLGWDKMFKINRLDVDEFRQKFNSGLIQSIDDVPEAVRNWPGKRNPYLPTVREYAGINLNFNLARFNDVDRNGIYDPLRGDFPRLPGAEGTSTGADQCIFWVTNDAGNQKRFNFRPGGASIGMEISTEAFAYSTSDYVNDMTFYRQKLVNKGQTTLRDCYFGQWADPDLGFANDDYVGFDVPRGLGICYNGDNFDEGVQGYGANPPSVAIDFFIGPQADLNDGVDNDKDGKIDEVDIDPETGGLIYEKIIASNFVYYNNSNDVKIGDPTLPQQYYNFLTSRWRDATPLTYDLGNASSPIGRTLNLNPPVVTYPTNYIFPGTTDKTAPYPWSEETARTFDGSGNPTGTVGNPPGDRRFLISAGKFTLQPGASNEMTIGVLWARASTGGSTGSFNKLLLADDEAQKLFDNNFKILSGPIAPDVELAEGDQEIVFSLTPAVNRLPSGQIQTSETYVEDDFASKSRFRFQGYLVYQFKDATSGFGDLGNPEKARLLADVSSDKKDGVGRIINTITDPELGPIPQVMVRGTDAGIKYTFKITSDAFASGSSKLINFRKYYFTVLAYGYDSGSKQTKPFILGRLGRKFIIATPHKTEVEFGGQQLNGKFGDILNLTKVSGVGTGGNKLNLSSITDSIILKNGSADKITYTADGQPVKVKVYSPKLVQKANLSLKLYGSVSYIGDPNLLRKGDVIVSNWASTANFTDSVDKQLITFSIDKNIDQKPGRAQVVSIRSTIEDNRTINSVELIMLNDGEGGRFATQFVGFKDGDNHSDLRVRSEPFIVENRPEATAMAIGTMLGDYWRLFDAGKLVDSSQRATSASPEQLSPKYGLSITLENVSGPLASPFVLTRNGFVAGEIEIPANQKIPWLIPVLGGSNDRFTRFNRWFFTGTNATTGLAVGDIEKYYALDITGIHKTNLSGSWGPYVYTNKYSTDLDMVGAHVPQPVVGTFQVNRDLVRESFKKIGNVDVVFTSDKSKWTRVVVIQGDSIKPTDGKAVANLTFTKSRISSISKDFTPDGSVSGFVKDNVPSASKGMSWFPGYAIDLDKGIRLNMAFLESSAFDPIKGNNLRWEPTDAKYKHPTVNEDSLFYGGKAYIYVFGTKYDEGKRLERTLDSLDKNIATFAVRRPAYARVFFECMYAGNMQPIDASIDPYKAPFDIKVKLRVDREYRSYPGIGGAENQPTYEFSTDALAASRNVENKFVKQLDLVRVVPNPYYAYSSYENSQADNRVKITNLPTKCTVSIYNLGGSLIRQFKIDNSGQNGLNATTFQDWDLKNSTGLPISSGAYIIQVDAGKLGSTTVKWLGVIRPTDLDAVSL